MLTRVSGIPEAVTCFPQSARITPRHTRILAGKTSRSRPTVVSPHGRGQCYVLPLFISRTIYPRAMGSRQKQSNTTPPPFLPPHLTPAVRTVSSLTARVGLPKGPTILSGDTNYPGRGNMTNHSLIVAIPNRRSQSTHQGYKLLTDYIDLRCRLTFTSRLSVILSYHCYWISRPAPVARSSPEQ